MVSEASGLAQGNAHRRNQHALLIHRDLRPVASVVDAVQGLHVNAGRGVNDHVQVGSGRAVVNQNLTQVGHVGHVRRERGGPDGAVSAGSRRNRSRRNIHLNLIHQDSHSLGEHIRLNRAIARTAIQAQDLLADEPELGIL